MATQVVNATPGSTITILVRAINASGSSDFATIQYKVPSVSASGGNLGGTNSATDIQLTGGSLFAGTFGTNVGLVDPATTNPSGSGVILNQYGIAGYATGTKKFYIDSRTGNAFFSGDITGSTGTFSGSITASSGSIGGWTINPTTLTSSTNNVTLDSTGALTIGSGSSIFKADVYGIYLGNSTFASAPFSVSPGGTLKATSGTIGGWTINTNNLKSTNNAVLLDNSQGLISVTDPNNINKGVYLTAGNGTPKLYIGSGNFGSMDTGFYADGAGYFSLGNQLTFTPGSTTTSKTLTSTIGLNSPNLILGSADSFVKVGMAITGTGIQSGTSVTAVSGTSVTMSLNALSTQISSPITFYQDNFSELNVTGRITGVINSVTPILSPRLTTSISQIVISGTSPSQTATVTTTGHAYLVAEKVLIEGFTTTGGLNNLNRSFSLASVTDSVTFTIDISGVTGVTSGTYSSLSNVYATLQEVTMGLHPQEGTSGQSYYHTAASGFRQDKYNWWFTNNQFRVGNALSYLKYDGTTFQIKGGSSQYLSLKVGGSNAQNSFAITSVVDGNSNPNPSFATDTTRFYVNGDGQFSLGSYITFDPTLTNPLLKIGGTGSTYSLQIQTSNIAANNLLSIYTTAGTPTYNNANTPFYVDGTGQFSLGTGLTWNGTTLTIGGTASIGGTTASTVVSNAAAGATALQSIPSNYLTTSTSISGGQITTGTIKNGSFNGTANGAAFNTAGMAINLDNSSITSPYFLLSSTGLKVKGDISGSSGTFSGSLTVGSDHWNTDGSFQLGGTTGITKGATGGISIGSNVTIGALSSYATQASLDTTNTNLGTTNTNLGTTNSNVSTVTNKTSKYDTSGNINGGISLNTAGSISAGKTSYTDTTVGWFLGYRTVSAGVYTPAFNIGGTSNYMKWDGSALTVTGNITGSSFSSPQGGITIAQSGSYDYINFISGASQSTLAFVASGLLFQGPGSNYLQMTTAGNTVLASSGNSVNMTTGGQIYLGSSSSATSSALRNSSIITVSLANSYGITNGSTTTTGYAVGDIVFTY